MPSAASSPEWIVRGSVAARRHLSAARPVERSARPLEESLGRLVEIQH
jgi:hypothetical protein